MSVIVWILLRLGLGLLASKVVSTTGEGTVVDILLGIVGAVVGGWLFNVFWRRRSDRLPDRQPLQRRCRRHRRRYFSGALPRLLPSANAVISAAPLALTILRPISGWNFVALSIQVNAPPRVFGQLHPAAPDPPSPRFRQATFRCGLAETAQRRTSCGRQSCAATSACRCPRARAALVLWRLLGLRAVPFRLWGRRSRPHRSDRFDRSVASLNPVRPGKAAHAVPQQRRSRDTSVRSSRPGERDRRLALRAVRLAMERGGAGGVGERRAAPAEFRKLRRRNLNPLRSSPQCR